MSAKSDYIVLIDEARPVSAISMEASEIESAIMED